MSSPLLTRGLRPRPLTTTAVACLLTLAGLVTPAAGAAADPASPQLVQPQTRTAVPPMYTPPAPNEAQVASLVRQERLLNDVHQLVTAGNRFGGSRSNLASAVYAARELLALGLDVQLVHDDPAVWTYDQGKFSLEWVAPDPAPATSPVGLPVAQEATTAASPAAASTGLEFPAAHPYSFSTNPGQPVVDLVAEVVYVGPGDSPEQYANARVAGKIVLMDGSPRRYYKLAKAAGAVAILTSYPSDPRMYQDSAMLSSLPPNDPAKLPVMALSYAESQALKARLDAAKATAAASAGVGVAPPVRLHLHVEQRVYQARPVTVWARLRPSSALPSAKFFLVTAHADGDSGGPSADDNASGVAAVLELARTLQTAAAKGVWQPTFGVEFALFGKEYHGAGAWLSRNADRLSDLLGVINFDEVGTGASRDAIFFESPDVPYNELLLRTLDSVGRDYVGQPGFWKEYATDDSLGGTDSYAFLATWTARGNGRYDGAHLIPATTIFTAAWNEPDVIPQVPFWPNKGLAAGDPVVVDYSAYYHSSRDVPETTTDKEPFNLVNAVRASALALLRLNHLFGLPTPFADDASARFDPNRLYAEALYRAGFWQPALGTPVPAHATPTAAAAAPEPAPAAGPEPTASAQRQPVAGLAQVPTMAEIEAVASRLAGVAATPGVDGNSTTTGAPGGRAAAGQASLTRLGLVHILARHAAATLPDEATAALILEKAGLADLGAIKAADQPAVALAVQQGWLLPQYDPDGRPLFAPDAAINRGESLKRLVWVLGARLSPQP